VTAGYLGAGIYRLAVTPTRGLGLKLEYSPASRSFKVLEVIRDGPAEKTGLYQGESIVTIDGQTATRFALYKLGLTANSQDATKLGMKASESADQRSVSVILASLPPRWFLALLAFGSLVCGMVSLVLNYRYPAPPEKGGKTLAWVLATAIFPVFLASVLVLISLFADLPLWIFLLLGLPACLAAPFFVGALGTGFDIEGPAWRNVIVGAAMLVPLPVLIAIHLTHPPGKDVDARDLVTDLGIDYLEALGMLLLLIALFVAVCWFFRSRRGYKMLPFLNAADMQFNGQAVSEELAGELQRIHDAHRDLLGLYGRYVVENEDQRGSSRSQRLSGGSKDKSKLIGSRVSEISTSPMTEKASLGEIATFKVGDNSFSLGQFFSDLKTFWAATDPKGIFGGSIRRHGADVRVIVSFREEGRTGLWSVVRRVEPEKHGNEFAKLLRELAFTIYPDIEENSACTTREALREYVEAIFQLKTYFESQDSQVAFRSLAKAVYFCRSACRAAANDEKVSPLLPMLLARTCLVREQMNEADEFSDLAIKMAPEPNEQRDSETAAAWWLRGWFDYKRGNYMGAERSFRGALDSDRKFEKAWDGLASVMLATNRRKQAVRAIAELGNCVHEKLKKKNLQERRLEEDNQRNKSLKKSVILADLFQEFGLSRHARAQCRAASKKRLKDLFGPNDIWVQIRLGGLLAETPGRSKAGLEILEKVRRGLEGRQAQLVAQINSDSAFRKIFIDVPKVESDLAAVSAALGHVYATLGLIHLGDSDTEGARMAEKEFRNAVKVAPTLGWAYSGLGEALHTAGRYADAEDTLQVGLHFGRLSGKEDPRTHYLLGDIYQREAETEKAIAHLTWAIALAPEWAEPHLMIGDIYASKGKPEKAIAKFKRVTDLEPQSADPHCRLGYLYRDMGKLDVSLEEFRIAQKLDPKGFDAFHGAGGTLRQMGRFSEAAEEFRSAIRIGGEEAYAHIALSKCYESLGQCEPAVQSRNAALALGDTGIAGKYNRACYWALMGDTKRALQLLSEAIGSGETTPLAVANDIDLASLYDHPGFKVLLSTDDRCQDKEISGEARGTAS
jgi:tetratricopeptide (TPR) repeat protein